MGVVFRAHDREEDRSCAIKILSPALARSRVVRERFRREAEALCRLQHPRVVSIRDFRHENELDYLVMEFIDGGSLQHWVSSFGAMHPRLATDAMLDVCSALTATHAQDIVHRDIKPQNILVAQDSTCRLVDFGIARLDTTSNLTRAGLRMGTVGFMAPEQQLSARDADQRADIFSVGATLFYLLTACIPTAMERALESHYDLLPPELAFLVTRATFPRPEQRYQSAAQLASVLERAREKLAPAPPRTPSLYQPVRVSVDDSRTGPTIIFED